VYIQPNLARACTQALDSGPACTPCRAQVTFDGSSLGSVCVSPTGEAWLLGDATSCVRLWCESDTPSCHAVPSYTEVRLLAGRQAAHALLAIFSCWG